MKRSFSDWKKVLAIVSGVAIFLISAFNSKNGFVGSTEGDWLLSLMGWAFAIAATSAEFMFTSDFKRLNWSLIFLGVCAYVYSIWTNILGLQAWRGTVIHYDMVNVLGGIFMDVYPEAAIAWALGESKMGDMLGNLFRAAQRKDELTDTSPRQSVDRMNQYRNQNPYKQPQQTPPQPYTTPAPRPAPRPVPAQPLIPNEPTYHPVSFQPKDLEEFLNKES